MAAAADATPSPEGFMTTHAKMHLADVALALRDEQLEAKVVHYRAELATNSELDAITDRVIADLREMQGIKRSQTQPPRDSSPEVDRAALEIELIQSLKEHLQRLFRPNKMASVLERKLGEVGKRFARLFFESELHDKLRGSPTELKKMRFSEQALYIVLSRHEPLMLKELDGLNYAGNDAQSRAKEKLQDFVRDVRNAFLAKTTPELNALLKVLNDLLRIFIEREMPAAVGELAWEVVKEAKLAERTTLGAGYKVTASAFPAFRTAFERGFLQRLVTSAADEMLDRARESATPFRQETIRFVADPQIFTDVCELVCDAVHDHLYNDGFLDLPGDWRARLATPGEG
jgi:hypothetical protein